MTTTNPTLTSNMRRVYLKEQVRHYQGRTLNIARRNHARQVLVEKCGYTVQMMQIVEGEARRQAGTV